MQNKKITILVYVICSLATTVARADPFSFKLNAGLSKLKEFCASPATGFTCVDKSTAITLDGGYKFNDTFGLDLGYGIYGSPKTNGPVLGSNLEVIQEISGYRLFGTVVIPVSNSFFISGKLGASRANLNIKSTLTPGVAIPDYPASSTSLAYGVGINYKLNKSSSLNIQYENLGKIGDATVGTEDSLALLTVGFVYELGKPKPTVNKSRPLQQGQSNAAAATAASLPAQRVVVFLQSPPPEDRQQLTAAIADACQCSPTFVRMHSNSAVVYQLNLPAGRTISTLSDKLLSGSSSLGIKALMQTRN